MTYTETNWSAMNNYQDILGVANTATAGYFWTSIAFMVFMVIGISLSGVFGWEAGFLVASFIGLMIQFLLVYMGLAGMQFLGIYIAIILAMIIYLAWRNRYD